MIHESDVLRHILHTYGLDSPKMPLAEVQRVLAAMIAHYEQIEGAPEDQEPEQQSEVQK